MIIKTIYKPYLVSRIGPKFMTLCWKRSCITISLAFLFSGLNIQSSLSANPVSLAMDDRPPFHFIDENGGISGATYLTVKCIFKKINHPLEVSILPWKRAQIQTKQGKFDGFFAASRNANRDEYATLSTPITDQYWDWYFLNGRVPDTAAILPNAGYKVTSWLGSNSYKWLEDNGYNPVAPSMSSKELTTSLFERNVDIIFGSNIVIDSQLDTHPDKLNVTRRRGLSKPMGIYFRKSFLKGNEGFLGAFNDASSECM